MDTVKEYIATMDDEVLYFSIRFTEDGRELEYYETKHGLVMNILSVNKHNRKNLKKVMIDQASNKNEFIRNMKENETKKVGSVTYTCSNVWELDLTQTYNGWSNWDTWSYALNLTNEEINLTGFSKKSIEHLTTEKLDVIYRNGIFFDSVDIEQVNVEEIKECLMEQLGFE